MKRYTFGFFVALTALPALAAGGVSRLLPDGTSTNSNGNARTPVAQVPSDASATRGTSGDGQTVSRVAITRNIPTRVVSENKTAARKTVDTVAQTDRGVAVARSQTNDSARSNLTNAVKTVGRNSRTEAASINNNPAVRRLGLSLRPSTAEVGGRAIILDSGKQTGSNMDSEIRGISSRAATKMDADAIAAAKEQLEQTIALNKSCQEMYDECMDQFCSVVDANQKRCSCSSNLDKYNKVEAAVKSANVKLNEVAQNIRYIGLTPDEVRAIMSETEAEEALSETRDKSESRGMLAKIEKMILDPSTSSETSLSDSFGLLDIDADFSADGLSDMFSLDSLFGDSNSGFSNLRGKNLYNAAKKRCDAVLKQCKDVGASSQQITGNYDLAIDKDCAAYEQGLNKMNETLVANVRSANRMLQKARLQVMQDQNMYDARACVSALETCMMDDVVCGDGYVKCLDPTKRYIDENGSVVLGANVGTIRRFMTEYNNAAITRTSVAEAYKLTISPTECSSEHNDGSCIVKYLIDKVGTKQKAYDEGMCRPVLDKCRAYTYDATGNYISYNDVVVSYIQRAMVNIKAAQSKIIADYASSCLTNIANCYNNQVSQLNSWTSAASASNILSVMRGACRNVALTCAYAVFDGEPNMCSENNQDDCLVNISETYYQSLLCPDNSLYVRGGPREVSLNGAVTTDENNVAWVNAVCKCNIGYAVQSGACVAYCPDNSWFDTSATETGQNVPVVNCKCKSGYQVSGTACVKIQDESEED